jgi:hypothetical protein
LDNYANYANREETIEAVVDQIIYRTKPINTHLVIWSIIVVYEDLSLYKTIMLQKSLSGCLLALFYILSGQPLHFKIGCQKIKKAIGQLC